MLSMSLPSAVRKMMGVCRLRARCLMIVATSKPSIPGIDTSSRITAKSSPSTLRSALDPEEAFISRTSGASSVASSARRSSSRSSTRRMLIGHLAEDPSWGMSCTPGLRSGRARLCSAEVSSMEDDGSRPRRCLARAPARHGANPTHSGTMGRRRPHQVRSSLGRMPSHWQNAIRAGAKERPRGHEGRRGTSIARIDIASRPRRPREVLLGGRGCHGQGRHPPLPGGARTRIRRSHAKRG